MSFKRGNNACWWRQTEQCSVWWASTSYFQISRWENSEVLECVHRGVACLVFCGVFFSVFYCFSKSGGVSNSIWEVAEDIVLCTTWFDFQDAHGENTPQGWQTCIKKKRKKKKGTKYCLVALIIHFYVVMCFIFFKITFNSENLLKAIQTSWPKSCTYWKSFQII